MTAQAPLAATAELHTAVNRLVLPSRARITRDDRTITRAQTPSLWAQLCQAITSGAGSNAHGVQTSKPPLDISALQLYLDITRAVRADCWAWRLKPTRITGEIRRTPTGHYIRDLAIIRHDTVDDLWRIVAAVNAHGDTDLIDNLTRTVHRWANQITTVISSDPDRTWRLHSVACRVCGSTTVPTWDIDGTETRQPAMIVHSDNGTIDYIECGFCGTKLNGDDLAMMLLDAQRRTQKQLRPYG